MVAPNDGGSPLNRAPILGIALRGIAQRTQTINQAPALIITGPDDVHTRFTGQTPAQLAALRPRPGSMVRYHMLLPLRELSRRACHCDTLWRRASPAILRANGVLAPRDAEQPR